MTPTNILDPATDEEAQLAVRQLLRSAVIAAGGELRFRLNAWPEGGWSVKTKVSTDPETGEVIVRVERAD